MEEKKTQTVCPYAKKCGGCQYQGVPYSAQLKKKQNQVQGLLKKLGNLKPVIGMKDPYFYRNKVHAVFDRDRKGNIISGIYEAGTHRVVSIEQCLIEDKKSQEIIRTIRGMLKSFKIKTYDEDTGYGLLRHVLVRKGYHSGQIMVVLVLVSPILPSKNNFVKALLKEHPEIKFQVGFNRRFDHNFAAIRKAYDDGKIGEAHILKITSRDPEPPNPAYIKVSGGIFLDMTIHDFDMACFLTDSDVEELYVNSAVLVDPAIGEQGDVDTAIITMKMANGALAVIDNSRKAAYGYDQRAELFGSKGMVATSNDTVSSAVISNADGVTGEKPLFFFLERYMGSFSEEMRQFTEAVINDTEVPVGIHAGLQSVKIGLAARKSVEEHRPVKISEIQ